MGKGSAAKKVARVARAGGRVSPGQSRGLLFPVALILVVVLGLALVAYAREQRRGGAAEGGSPGIGDHIHLAKAFHACGEFLPDLPYFESRVGIHTHGDGLIHVHPHSEEGVGANATLGRYFYDAAGEGDLDVALSDDRVVWMGDSFEEGDAARCEGVENPQLRLAYWEDVQAEGSAPRVITAGFEAVRLNEDGAGITVFYGPPDAEIPKPPSAEWIDRAAADPERAPAPAEGPAPNEAPAENPGP